MRPTRTQAKTSKCKQTPAKTSQDQSRQLMICQDKLSKIKHQQLSHPKGFQTGFILCYYVWQTSYTHSIWTTYWFVAILHLTFLITSAAPALNKYLKKILSTYYIYMYNTLFGYYNKPFLHMPSSHIGLLGSFIKHS